MDFSSTRISLSRPVTSYSRVRRLISFALRKWPRKRPYPHESFYLDLGPGPNPSADFFSIDYNWVPGIQIVCDLTKKFDPPNERVLGCYTEHFLEHIPFEDAILILKKVHACLVPGGVLRVIVPDLQIYCAAVVDENSLGSRMALPNQREICGVRTAATSLNDAVRLHGHLFLWDYSTLEIVLRKAGFDQICRQEFGRGRDPKLLKDSSSRAYESLYVEAVK